MASNSSELDHLDSTHLDRILTCPCSKSLTLSFSLSQLDAIKLTDLLLDLNKQERIKKRVFQHSFNF